MVETTPDVAKPAPNRSKASQTWSSKRACHIDGVALERRPKLVNVGTDTMQQTRRGSEHVLPSRWDPGHWSAQLSRGGERRWHAQRRLHAGSHAGSHADLVETLATKPALRQVATASNEATCGRDYPDAVEATPYLLEVWVPEPGLKLSQDSGAATVVSRRAPRCDVVAAFFPHLGCAEQKWMAPTQSPSANGRGVVRYPCVVGERSQAPGSTSPERRSPCRSPAPCPCCWRAATAPCRSSPSW